MAKEKNEELLKELQLMKETQGSFLNLMLALELAGRIIVKTKLRIFKMIIEKRQNHQRPSLILLFRLMVPNEEMGLVKQTLPKE